VIEVYAITDDPSPPAPPLRAVGCDGLTALCAPAESRPLTHDVLWRHEERVEALMEKRDLLPLRFGTLVADEQAAAREVARRREELVAALEHVRGAVELAVRSQPREAEQAQPRRGETGRDYLRAKARRTQAARLLHEPLAFVARDSVVHTGPDLLRAAYLVDRAALDGFVALVRRLQAARQSLNVVCTGPWPPYSFVEGA
jgi:Gas vesicle synthesis protein GvpL/GvpF